MVHSSSSSSPPNVSKLHSHHFSKMELSATHCCCVAKFQNPHQYQSSSLCYLPNSIKLPTKLLSTRTSSRFLLKQRNTLVVAVNSSSPGTETTTTTADVSDERWLLQPVGDGDSRHIGYRVSLPGSYEIASDAVTVGRVSDKADLVIPVATVSGVHARIQNKGGSLLVTDLGSTNGTYINEKPLRPGVAATLTAGSFITFGDSNLAVFRVLKLESTREVPTKSEESEEAKPETEEQSVQVPEPSS